MLFLILYTHSAYMAISTVRCNLSLSDSGSQTPNQLDILTEFMCDFPLIFSMMYARFCLNKYFFVLRVKTTTKKYDNIRSFRKLFAILHKRTT